MVWIALLASSQVLCSLVLKHTRFSSNEHIRYAIYLLMLSLFIHKSGNHWSLKKGVFLSGEEYYNYHKVDTMSYYFMFDKNVTFFVRLIPWSDDAYGSLKAMFMDLNISVLGHNEKVLNVNDGIGQHTSRCSSNASGSSGNRSFSNQFDTFLNGDFKRILVVGELGELTCVYSIVKICGIGFLKYCNTMYCLCFATLSCVHL